MNTSLYSRTPMVTVLDNRGLTVRNIAYHRHPDKPKVTDERITYHQHDERGFLTQSADPRLHDAGLVNFRYLTDLAGSALRTQGADNGTTVALSDVAGRPFMSVSNIITADDGTEDRSQAVTCTWQYEEASLPGRLLSVTEQLAGEVTRITDRFIYAGNGDAEKTLNLAGQCVSHYDTAGLMQTNSVALTGVPLSVTRRLLKDADNPDTVADWKDDDASAWNDLLEPEEKSLVTQSTADATGAVLTTIDAKGNVQRVAYDVAGLLSGSWLTLNGGVEQAIVKSLTYSAAGQKLREEHGNGVVTLYTYEPETQRLTGIRTERPSGHVSRAKVLQDLRYEYDPVGNVLKISNDAEETRFWRNQKVVPENTYVYDTLYQLVSATGREMADASQQSSHLPSATVPLPTDSSAYTNYSRTWTYDSAGNLTRISHTPATGSGYTTDITVSEKSNRGVLSTLVTETSDVDSLFTAGGQQKQLQPGQNLIWTPRNELLQVTPVVRDGEVNDRESYRYDAGSQRILKVSVQKTGNSTQTQRVLYQPGLELRSTKSGDTETESLQVITVGEAGRAQVRVLHWENGKPDAIDNDQIRWSYDNLTGSSQIELDDEGSVISMEEYYPYGGTAVWAARSQTESDYKIIRYSGKERDATGLYYYGYRYYQPWAGRWLSADPAGTVDGLNLFCMVANNPVTFSDNDGLLITGQEARKQVAEKFILDIHMPAFERVSKENNVAVSVREAGVYTIEALREGAAAKGHNILAKTIKPSSLEAAYGDKASEALNKAKRSGLIGRVGQWFKSGVKGVYVHSRPSSGDRPFRVSIETPQNNELLNQLVKHGILTPYTGDYDMHDIILYSGGKGRVPDTESQEEKKVINNINKQVASLDPLRPFEKESMNVVRHGPQVNFVHYMWKYEFEKVVKDNGYSKDVANPGAFPLAMVHQGEWSIIENKDELVNFYKTTNTPFPEHWSQSFVKKGNNMVLTPQHAKALDKWRAMQRV